MTTNSPGAPIIELDDLIAESEVLDRWGHLFSYHELLNARKSGRIRYVKRKRMPHYTEAWVLEYLQRGVSECQNDSSPIADIGLGPSTALPGSMNSGMTREQEERESAACAQTILKPPKKSSSGGLARAR